MKKLIFFLLLVCSFSVYGQRNFREGYIIKQVGDTTFGQVAYRTNKTSALITHFREAKGKPIQTFNPENLIGFGYTNDKYMESKTLGFVENQAYKVFVEIIFKGKISLYRYKNDYIFEKEGIRHLITNRKLIELNIGEKTLVYSDDDVRTLATLVSDCHRAVIDQSGFKIVDKYLIQILKVYHQCLGEDYLVFKEDKLWTKLQFGLFGGINSSKLNFESANQTNDFLVKGNFNSARSLFFGFELNFSSPRVTDSYELITGFQFMKTHYYGFSELPTPTGSQRNDIVIYLDKTIIPVGIRYSLQGKDLLPYLSFGMNFTSHNSISMDWTSEALRDQVVVSNSNQIPFESKSSQFGLWFSLGVSKQLSEMFNGFIEVKFESANGLVKSGIGQNFELNSSISNVQFLMGIRF